MNALEIQDVAPLRGPRPAGATPVDRKPPSTRQPRPPRVGRRSILKAGAASATALGLSALGVFPAARRAYADGYAIWTSTTSGPCHPTTGYARNHNCSPGCGPSPVFNACCASSGYFKNGGGGGNSSCHLRPNECYKGGWDGWLWSYGAACDGCRTIQFRCHDGLRCRIGCTKAICRWITRCT